MSKVYNLTDKMNFEDNPKIKVKNTELEIIADAKTVLKLIDISDEAEDNFQATMKGYEVIFSEADRKKIDKMKLNAHDFTLLINTALQIAMGMNPDENEGEE